MTEWRWLDPEAVIALHERQLAEHGGAAGTRDTGLFESALGRPRNLAAYGDPDAAALAASYAFGLVRNHAFIDGNKRTGWIAARLFLRINGVALAFDKADALRTVLALAAGELTEDVLADWFRERIVTSA